MGMIVLNKAPRGNLDATMTADTKAANIKMAAQLSTKKMLIEKTSNNKSFERTSKRCTLELPGIYRFRENDVKDYLAFSSSRALSSPASWPSATASSALNCSSRTSSACLASAFSAFSSSALASLASSASCSSPSA